MPAGKSTVDLLQAQRVNLLVVILLANGFAFESPQILPKQNMGPNKTLKLVEKIRRLLMKDNYDYMSSGENTTLTLREDDRFETTQATSYGRQEDKPPDQQKIYTDRLNKYLDQLNKTAARKPPVQQNRYPIPSENPPNQREIYPKHNQLYPYQTKDPNNDNKLLKYQKRQEKLSEDKEDNLDQYPNRLSKSSDLQDNDFEDLNDSDQKELHTAPDKYFKQKESYSSDEALQHTVPSSLRKKVYSAGVAFPRSRDASKSPDIDHGFSVSQKDLLYYMDDKRMRRKGSDESNMLNTTSTESEDYFRDVITSSTSKAKYKMLKVRGADANRRKMAVRRFVEEKNSDGVAIFRLDDEPFPQFLLPRSRRQYMFADEVDLNAKFSDSAISSLDD